MWFRFCRVSGLAGLPSPSRAAPEALAAGAVVTKDQWAGPRRLAQGRARAWPSVPGRTRPAAHASTRSIAGPGLVRAPTSMAAPSSRRSRTPAANLVARRARCPPLRHVTWRPGGGQQPPRRGSWPLRATTPTGAEVHLWRRCAAACSPGDRESYPHVRASPLRSDAGESETVLACHRTQQAQRPGAPPAVRRYEQGDPATGPWANN